MKILKNKNRKYEEERGYGESTGRITNGWFLSLKKNSTGWCLRMPKPWQLATLSWSVTEIQKSSIKSFIT